MTIKIGINSFGRIGRVVFRTCCQNSEIKVSAINDPAIDAEYMCYLIKFDSTHGKYAGRVTNQGDEIKIDDETVKVFHHKQPADIPWHQAGVQYVVEASGMFTSLEKASGHLASDTVRRVIVTAPSSDVPMLILGVNEDKIQPDIEVISCASSTLYCLAPLVKILDDAFGVAEGFVTSIHAMTPTLKPLDSICPRSKHWREHRSFYQNIIPASTNACKALGRIIPSCKDKLAGIAFRVPIVNVSILDMSIRLKKDTTLTGIYQTIGKINNTVLRNSIHVVNEKAVSSDFIGDKHSCILDMDSSLQITSNFFKLICWYENEYSYSCRVVETVLFSERQFRTRIPPFIPNTSYKKTIDLKALRRLKLENNSETDLDQGLLFYVPTFQNTPLTKTGSRKIIRSPASDTAHSVVQQENSKSGARLIKSYIDRFTKCKCNLQNKTKPEPPSQGKERTKTQRCSNKVEYAISDIFDMTEELLNKSVIKKSFPILKQVSKETTEKELALLKANIITKISDTLKTIKKEKSNCNNNFQPKKSLDVGHSHDKISQTNSLNKSDFNAQSDLTFKSRAENVVPNLSLKRSNIIRLDYSIDHNCKKCRITNDLKLQITKQNKTVVEANTCVIKSSLDNISNVPKKHDVNNIVPTGHENLEPAIKLIESHSNLKVSDSFPSKSNMESENTDDSELKINESSNEDVSRTDVVEVSEGKLGSKVETICVNRNGQRYAEPVTAVAAKALVDMNTNIGKGDQVLDNTELPQNNTDISRSSNHQHLDQISLIDPIEKNTGSVLMCVTSPSSFVSNEGNNNYNAYKDPKDIYDKLKSNSVSSESLRQINEKTSQIINISDLTFSLEDLDRLDKLCRVIEISDELSDKMFSALDNENDAKTSRKKWSFQDLCERIKFDEFCNDLFEKSAS